MLFEVKGWNLSAPLVTQTEDSQRKGNDINNGVGKSGSRSSRSKRKRGVSVGDQEDGLAANANAAVPLTGAVARAASTSASDAALMSADRIGMLWERHVEKKVKNKKQKEKEKKKKSEANGTIEVKKRTMESSKLERDQDKKRIEDGKSNRIHKDANANGGARHNDDEVKDGKDEERKRDSRSTKVSKAERVKKRKLLNANDKSITPAANEGVQGAIDETMPAEVTAAAASAQSAQSEASPPTKLTPLQNQMREKLISARFRRLNETLYTSPSIEAVKLFQSHPDLFQEYHAGFARQVATWPANPVDGFISAVLARGKVEAADQKRRTQHKQNGKNKKRKKTKNEEVVLRTEEQEQTGLQPLPRTRGTCNIADIGCGTAPFARALQPHMSRLGLLIRSFDLMADGSDSAGAAPSPPVHIEQADMCALPVASGAVDIAILCLALMGTNWPEAIDEAWRALRWKGELWIAETKSRFGHAANNTTSGGKSGAGGSSIGRKKAAVVPNSNTKLQKRKKNNGSRYNYYSSSSVISTSDNYADEENNGNAEEEEEDDDDNDDNDNEADEDVLGTSTSVSSTIANTITSETTTHLIPFLTVLQKRGFVLAQDGLYDDYNKNKKKKNKDENSDTPGPTTVPLLPLRPAASALDTSNKMFVTMRLVKASMPVRGKNKKVEEKVKQQQQQRQRQKGRGKWRTVVAAAAAAAADDDDDDNSNDRNDDWDDAKVLKACVYKLR